MMGRTLPPAFATVIDSAAEGLAAPESTVTFDQPVVGQRLERQLVEGIARVAQQLAQEHLAVAVERVDDDPEDLVDLRLKGVFLHCCPNVYPLGPHTPTTRSARTR